MNYNGRLIPQVGRLYDLLMNFAPDIDVDPDLFELPEGANHKWGEEGLYWWKGLKYMGKSLNNEYVFNDTYTIGDQCFLFHQDLYNSIRNHKE